MRGSFSFSVRACRSASVGRAKEERARPARARLADPSRAALAAHGHMDWKRAGGPASAPSASAEAAEQAITPPSASVAAALHATCGRAGSPGACAFERAALCFLVAGLTSSAKQGLSRSLQCV